MKKEDEAYIKALAQKYREEIANGTFNDEITYSWVKTPVKREEKKEETPQLKLF